MVVEKDNNSHSQEIDQYHIIDGQQRLMTVSIFLAAIAKRAKQLDSASKLSREIKEDYLVNRHEEEGGELYYKIKPSKRDKESFDRTMDLGGNREAKEDKILKCYNFYKQKIKEYNESELEKVKKTLLYRFKIVSIEIGEKMTLTPYLKA